VPHGLPETYIHLASMHRLHKWHCATAIRTAHLGPLRDTYIHLLASQEPPQRIAHESLRMIQWQYAMSDARLIVMYSALYFRSSSVHWLPTAATNHGCSTYSSVCG
jgi:hypothetical protein